MSDTLIRGGLDTVVTGTFDTDGFEGDAMSTLSLHMRACLPVICAREAPIPVDWRLGEPEQLALKNVGLELFGVRAYRSSAERAPATPCGNDYVKSIPSQHHSASFFGVRQGWQVSIADWLCERAHAVGAATILARTMQTTQAQQMDSSRCWPGISDVKVSTGGQRRSD